MADILNLQVKDETLSNIISNNPYYVDIKGSVNICLIRCGQEIENCNSVNFSTMTNYGKILVLNPDKTKLSKCNIKLAFDNNNDTINNDGNGKYTFEKAFFTVPSLHKLNGQVFDMETFLLFSSVQKNGTILYVCLCVFNTGTNIVQNDDPKLLNFKLLNELFSKGNSVPDIYGTNQINGIPNPVDLSNFIPEEGSRNFYDYTHPLNTKVNFRIFQTSMYVSNDIISLLKSKLTPGNIYQNFRNYITKSINPHEGLFFYFSEDLTNHYKSFQKNNIQKDNFKNIADSIIEEQEIFEKEEDFKKLDIKKDVFVEEEEDKIDYNIINKDEINKDEINKSETFSSKKKNESNNSITIIIFIVSFMLIVNVLNVLLVNNLFTPSKNIVDSDLPNYLNEMVSSDNMKNVLGTKFRNYCALFWQGIITFLVIILLIFYMSNNNSEQKIYTSILIFLSLIFINSFIILIFNIKYFVYRLKSLYDDNFSQKENYLLDFILKKTYKNNTPMNIINILKGDFSSFVNIQTNPPTNPQSGGSLEHPNLVPGPDDDDESLKSFKYKEILDKKTFWELILNPFDHDIYSIFKEKFNNNYSWKQNLFILFGMTILFFIIGILFQLKYILLGNNSLLLFIVSGIITVFLYIPVYYICLISIYKYFFVNKEIYKKMYWVIFGISCVGLFISLFIPFGNVGKKKNLLSNVPFWLNIGCIILCILIIVISNFIKSGAEKIDENIKNEENEAFNGATETTETTENKIGTAPNIENEILNEYLKTKNKLNEIQEKQILYDEEDIKGNNYQSTSITRNNIENEILLLIELLKEIVDKILFYEKELENIGDSNKKLIEEKIESLRKKKEEIEKKIKIYMGQINNYSNHTKENSEKVQKLSEELNKIKEHMSNRDESLLLLKNISNEQKEKEMLYKDYFNYSIDELEKTIENILEFVKLYKLNSVISSLYFTLKLINKLKEIEEKRSDIEYNEKIIEILDKLKGIDFSKSINEDIKKLDSIKDNKTRIQIEKTLNSVEEQIRTIVKNINVKKYKN
jgi:carbonic anhydrase